MSARSTENSDSLWERMFAALEAFRREHGHCNVPKRFPENPRLGEWVIRQRQARQRGTLSPERLKRLEALGLSWNPSADASAQAWERMFAELAAYRERCGHTDVSRRSEDRALATWLEAQRRALAQGKLPADRAERLESLGVGGGSRDRAWDGFLAKLSAFRERFGHTDVPSTYAEDPALAAWVERQRLRERAGKLDPERAQRLTEVGFTFRKSDADWEQHFQALRAFKAEHGHCDVTKSAPDLSLYHWVHGMRRQFARGQLSSDRAARLRELGFSFRVEEQIRHTRYWEDMYQRLLELKARRGHLRVGPHEVGERALGTWIRVQRGLSAKGEMRPERRRKLEAIGFSFDVREDQWLARATELESFLRAHGPNENPPREAPTRRLAEWVDRQRVLAAKGRLEPSRRQHLDALGFAWSLLPRSVEEAGDTELAALGEFRRIHGHLDVPRALGAHRPLAEWMDAQRALWAEGTLDARLTRALEARGFPFTADEIAWEASFARLASHARRHGHLRLPSTMELAGWLETQRALARAGQLPLDREERLEAIGALGGTALVEAPAPATAPARAEPRRAERPVLAGVSGLTQRFGRKWALRDVGFTVRQGEVLGVTGAAGAGKTTLLHALAGLLPADGAVTFQGAALSPERRKDALFFLPENVQPWPERQVGWVLDFIQKLHGGAADARAEVERALGLAPWREKRMSALSVGQRKRVLLAAALLTPQPLLLLDEPFEGMLPEEARAAAGLLRDVAARDRTLLIALAPGDAEAAALCERHLLLAEGRAVGEGTLEALRTKAGRPGAALEEVLRALA